MSLKQDIIGWDKKSKKDIERIYEAHKNDRSFVNQLFKFSDVLDAQCGATWLIKHHLETSETLPNLAMVSKLFNAANQMPEWQSRLHVLQIAHHFSIPEQAVSTAYVFFTSCVADENKFIRAWAFSAIAHLASDYDQYREEAFNMLHTGLDREVAGSIRSRLNKGLKMLMKTSKGPDVSP